MRIKHEQARSWELVGAKGDTKEKIKTLCSFDRLNLH